MPRVFLAEQVMGFGKSFKKEASDWTPKGDFVSEVLAITDRSGETPHFTNCLAITLDSKEFVTAHRPRFLGWCCCKCEHSDVV